MLMMKFFSSWAEQIIIAVVISSIIEMVLPDNKNKKYVKMVLGIYILFNIISPVINKKDLLAFDNFDLESYAASAESIGAQEVNQNSMDERLQQLYIEELKNNVKAKVQEKGFTVRSCKVDAVLTGNEKNQGINKISLVVAKNTETNSKKDNSSNDSNVKAVNRVEVKVGLDRLFENNADESDSNNELQALKNELCNYYELDASKIQISF